MKYDSQKHHRRSVRLTGYDYAQSGAYFVTFVTQNRIGLFGAVVNGEAQLNDAGRMLQAAWSELTDHYPAVEPDTFVVMPNHFHGIIINRGQPQGVAPTISLPDVVHRFKTLTTKRYTDGVKQSGWTPFPSRLWQRNYYEHIIRDEKSLSRIREYILNNPAQWAFDRENPEAISLEPKDAWQAERQLP